MLPAEIPLSLARTVVPAPPPMATENRRAIDTHQGRTPHVMVPAAMSNALAAHSVHAKPLVPGQPTVAQDQTGNAAVAAMRLAAPVPLVVVPRPASTPGR